MKKIAIVKGCSTFHEELVKVFQEDLPEHTVTSYHAKQLFFLYNNNHVPDLLIMEQYIEKDIQNILDYTSRYNTKIAVCTSSIEKMYLTKLFKMGFDGYLYKEMDVSEISFAINSMLNEKLYIHPRLSSFVINEYIKMTDKKRNRPVDLLTKREWDVLEQIVKGNNNKEIGENLFISPRTVKNHITSILKKLDVPDRTNAALLALKQNWFDI